MLSCIEKKDEVLSCGVYRQKEMLSCGVYRQKEMFYYKETFQPFSQFSVDKEQK